jgi:hypothetical protein
MKRRVIIFQMGKIGSKTVQKTLFETGEFWLIHSHGLSDRFLRSKMQAYKNSDDQEPENALLWTIKLREKIQTFLQEQLLIISLTRDPVATIISAFLQNMYWQNQKLLNADGRPNVQQSIETIKKYISELDVEQDYFLNWFDNELKEVFKFDVYKYPFNHNQGFSIYVQDNISILIVRLENFSSSLINALNEFLNISLSDIYNDNLSSDKEYHTEYCEIKNNIKLDENILDLIYSTKYVKHFYTEDEIKIFRSKWKKK